jgi:uncharacterized protein
MARLLFWILLGLAVYAAVRWWQRQSAIRRSAAARRALGNEDMLSCQVCGLNVPRSEALLADGRAYCCEAHRQRRGSSD